MDEPPVTLARAESPRGEVVLRRGDRDGRPVLELRVNGAFVMDDAETTSERALATASLARCASPRRVLVGGLGLGFTLAGVTADDRVEAVTVVEIEPAVVGWMRGGTVPHGPSVLADPRVEVLVADVAEVLAGAPPGAYDLVLLDVDNGPAWLVHPQNAALYGVEVVATCRRVLAAGGLLVVWSTTREPALLTTMRQVFAATEPVDAVAHPVRLAARDAEYWLHLAQRA